MSAICHSLTRMSLIGESTSKVAAKVQAAKTHGASVDMIKQDLVRPWRAVTIMRLADVANAFRVSDENDFCRGEYTTAADARRQAEEAA